MTSRPASLAALAILSGAFLFHEITAIRFFTLAHWYHFGSLVVSLALFGVGASGVVLALVSRIRDLGPERLAAGAAIGFGITAWAGLHLAGSLRFEPFWVSFGLREILALVGWGAAFGVPFFFAALGTAALFVHMPERAGPIYAADLVGAAAGTLGALVGWSFVAPAAGALAAGLGFVAAILWSQRRLRALFFCAPILVLAVMVPPSLPVSPYKPLSRLLEMPATRVIAMRWQSAHHIALLEAPTFRDSPGLSLDYVGMVPAGRVLLEDGAGPGVWLPEGVPPEFLRAFPAAVAHELAPDGRALILDAAGNLEWLRARAYRRAATVITSVEPPKELGLPPEFVEAAPRRALAEAAPGSYAIIEVALRSGAAEATGALAQPGEGYLFTVEAFRAMARALAPGGVGIITRPTGFPPRDSLRLSLTARDALGPRHVAVLRSALTFTVLFSPDPLEGERAERLLRAAEERGYDVIHLAGAFCAPAFHLGAPNEADAQALAEAMTDPSAFVDRYVFDVRPATDDRPFPWVYLRPTRFFELLRAGIRWEPLFDGGFLLGAAFVMSIVFALFLLLPPFVRRARPAPGTGPLLVYMVTIGFAFVFVEIPLAQALLVAARTGAHAFGVVLGSMLFAAGVGALHKWHKVHWGVAGAAILALVLALALPIVRALLLRAPAPFLVGALLAAAPAWFMGAALPAGMRFAGTRGAETVAWAWAANGAASVVAPILANLIGLWLGLSATLVLASALYVAAALLLRALDVTGHGNEAHRGVSGRT